MIRGKTVAAVVPAAGKGRRMRSKQNKQFLELGGKPIIVHTLVQLQKSREIDAIVVATDSVNIGAMRDLVRRYGLTKILGIVRGGRVRQDSVWNCLQFLRTETPDLVLVHDAVRPFIRQEDIRSVLRAALKDRAAILAVSPKETIKLSIDGTYVHDTPDRDTLWVAQTPQAFHFDLLYNAVGKARANHFTGTDDSSIVERLGVSIRLVNGSYENIKITTPEDMDVARLILKRWDADHSAG